MTRSSITTILLLLLAFAGVALLGGCQTWKGLGRDIEHVGDSMQGDDSEEHGREESADDDG